MMFNNKINLRNLYLATDERSVIDNYIVIIKGANIWCEYIEIYINEILIVTFGIKTLGNYIFYYKSVYKHKIPKEIIRLINNWSKGEVKRKKLLEHDNTLKTKEKIQMQDEILNEFYKKHGFEHDDVKAIENDWKAVGKDIKKYIK